MTRIVAGSARGRRIRVPGSGTRPTSDRVREAVFSALEHRLPGPWTDTAVLDAFAGSGALGLEAWSRGARSVLLVERDARAARVASDNVAELGARNVHVLRTDAWKLPPRTEVRQAQDPCDLVFLDPPYADSVAQLHGLLAQLVEGQWLREGALAVVERSARERQWEWPTSWDPLADRRYSDTRIHLGALVASPTSATDGRG